MEVHRSFQLLSVIERSFAVLQTDLFGETRRFCGSLKSQDWEFHTYLRMCFHSRHLVRNFLVVLLAFGNNSCN